MGCINKITYKIIMKKTIVLYYVFLLIYFSSNAQVAPFTIYLEPMSINNSVGLQAFSYGQHNGKWLIIGGRLDGLHRRQPNFSFDDAGNNKQIIVIDPIAQQQWTTSINTLPIAIKEQLSSTNMEFHQYGNYLYIIGGYGFNAATASKKTFDNLISINVPNLIDAVINNTNINIHFRQISDPKFAVTGGHLKKINDLFYLVGGNQFDGNYNPMGNPTYTQVYTNAIRKFSISDDGINLSVAFLPEQYDATNLHRRDFNVVPQIYADGSEGITAFSGVFQPTINLPFLNCVNIDSINYVVNNSFQQHYNHYHCAVLPAYSKSKKEMHNVFFGGIAQYYDSLGYLVQDPNVPFVKTIARVTRDSIGVMSEYKLPIEMPTFLGAGSEFILNLDIPHFTNEVINLDSLNEDTTLAGYIYGGISSSAPNIFFINTGVESNASSQIFKVFIIKNNQVGIDQLNTQSNSNIQAQISPNPNDGNLRIKLTLKQKGKIKLSILNAETKLIESVEFINMEIGDNTMLYKFQSELADGTYYFLFETKTDKIIQKITLRK